MWGAPRYGHFGNSDPYGEDQTTPVKVADDVIDVSCGDTFSDNRDASFTAVVLKDGSLWTQGVNDNGQLGDGTTNNRYELVKIMDGVASVSLGGNHSAAISEDGSLWTWGSNYAGKLGRATSTVEERVVPGRVPGFGAVSTGHTPDPGPESGGAVIVESKPEDTEETDFKLEGGLELTVPKDVPLLGGTDVSLDYGMVPVEFRREGNQWRIGIGVDDMDELIDGGGWTTFKKFVETQNRNIAKGLRGLDLAVAYNATVLSGAVEPKMSIWGFAEGTIVEDGIQISRGKISVGMHATGKWEWQTVVVVPVVITFSADVGVDSTSKVGVDLDEASVYVDSTIEMTLPDFMLTGGIGVAYVADVSVYGSASNIVTLERGLRGNRSATLSGELGARARFLCFEYEKALLDGDWKYYDSARRGRSAVGGAGAAGSSGGWFGVERDIAGAWTSGRATSRSLAPSGGASSPGGSLLQLQPNVYDGAEPRMLETESGVRAIVYTLDQEGMPDAHSTTPYVSVYDEAAGTWREPVPLLGEGAVGYDASCCVVGDTVWVAQVEPGAPLTDAQLALPVEEQLGIVASGSSVVLRAAEVSADGSVVPVGEPVVLSGPGAGGLMPSVEACELADGSEGLVVAWVENPACDPLGMSGENTVRSVAYAADGGSLAERASSSTGRDVPVTEVAAGSLGGSVAVAFVEDADGDLSTTSDRTLRALDAGSGDALGLTGSGASGLRFARIGADDCLAWYDAAAGSVLYGASADAGSGEVLASGDSISADFSIVGGGEGQLLLTCEARDEEGGSDLVARRLDPGGSGGVTASGPVTLTEEPGYVSDATGLSDGDGWDVVLLRSDVTIGGEGAAPDGEGQVSQVANLCVLDVDEAASPEVTSAELSLYGGEGGDVPTVRVEVKNDGLSATSAGTVSVSLGGGQVASLDVPAMGAGESRTLDVPAPSIVGGVAAGDEARVSLGVAGSATSSATVEAGLVDLVLEAEGGPDGVSYEVGNDGTAPSRAILEVREGDVSGTLLSTIDLGTVVPGAAVSGSLGADEVVSWGAGSVCLVAAPADVEDACESDNSVFVYASDEGALGAPLERVRVSLPDASFEAGEPLDLSGMEVTAVLEDGTEVASSSYETNASEIDTSTPGEAELVVTCRYAERTATVAVPIEIVGEPDPEPDPVPSTRDMYRLYNRWTGEHFYTASAEERDGLIAVGWTDEGLGWVAPATGDPVYRLYNPYVTGGDHHYTLSATERDELVAAGWEYEGVGWMSAPASAGVPLWRQYNPYAATGTHNYTTSRDENDHLVSVGWREEGVGWYGVG
nr:bacterial Ig-like domain-containing protein [Olsenella sp. SW781]